MEYFGYLRRNPDDPPEPTLDYSGYDFWLSKLNQLKGDFAELVKAFITSDEYTQRLGAGKIPPINIQEYLPVPEIGQTVTVSSTGIHGQIAAPTRA